MAKVTVKQVVLEMEDGSYAGVLLNDERALLLSHLLPGLFDDQVIKVYPLKGVRMVNTRELDVA